jgi:hypothetical protein
MSASRLCRVPRRAAHRSAGSTDRIVMAFVPGTGGRNRSVCHRHGIERARRRGKGTAGAIQRLVTFRATRERPACDCPNSPTGSEHRPISNTGGRAANALNTGNSITGQRNAQAKETPSCPSVNIGAPRCPAHPPRAEASDRTGPGVRRVRLTARFHTAGKTVRGRVRPCECSPLPLPPCRPT